MAAWTHLVTTSPATASAGRAVTAEHGRRLDMDGMDGMDDLLLDTHRSSCRTGPTDASPAVIPSSERRRARLPKRARFAPGCDTAHGQTGQRPRACHADGMPETFTYVPHPHTEARLQAGPPKVVDARLALHGPGPIARLNAKIGLRITVLVGTMWTAYVFTVIALVSAPSAFSSGNVLIIVAWIAQTFLQLVLLPIIIVGQNVQAAAADARSQATYDDASAVLAESKQIQLHLLAQDEKIASLLDQVQALRSAG